MVYGSARVAEKCYLEVVPLGGLIALKNRAFHPNLSRNRKPLV